MTRVPDERTRRWPGAQVCRGVVLALAATALLAGCAGQPGAAAVVDGDVITVADLHAAVEQLSPFYDGATAENVLAVLVQEPTVRAFAAEQGVAVSDQAAREQLDQAAAQVKVEPAEEYEESSIAVSRYLIVWEQLTALPDAATIVPDLQRQLGKLDVEVSPRFGAVGEGNELVDLDRPWLVTTDDEATGQ